MLDHNAVRTRLETRFAELGRRQGRLDAHLRNANEPASADSEEQAQQLEGEEVVAALDDATRREFAAVKHALERLSDGTFETCEACGEPIGARRLEAQPTVTRCVDCALAAER